VAAIPPFAEIFMVFFVQGLQPFPVQLITLHGMNYPSLSAASVTPRMMEYHWRNYTHTIHPFLSFGICFYFSRIPGNFSSAIALHFSLLYFGHSSTFSLLQETGISFVR
tara:strand:- start:273 stop:599 length:327 start_codon:yes stop_codon:yes gene_type:complete